MANDDQIEALNRALTIMAAKMERSQTASVMDMWDKVHPFFKVAVFVATSTWMIYSNFVRVDVYKEDARSVQAQIASIHVRMEKNSDEMRAYIDAKFRESNERSDGNRKSVEQQLTLINDNVKTLLIEKEVYKRR